MGFRGRHWGSGVGLDDVVDQPAGRSPEQADPKTPVALTREGTRRQRETMVSRWPGLPW